MLDPVSTVGTVRVWYREDGWGVIDSVETPGGCWTHFSNLAMPGFRSLSNGQQVELEWEAPGQDGFAFRAVRAWPRGEQPHEPPACGSGAGYASVLTVRFPALTGINRYPVKSCRGHALDEAAVEPWGLAGDRRWMLVDDDGVAVTARKHPRMVLITPWIRPDGLLVEAAGAEPLVVGFPVGRPQTEVTVWSSTVAATPADDGAHAWFSAVLGTPVRLVHLDDPTLRPTDPRYSLDTDVVSFADGYPVLLAVQESFAALAALCPEPLTMTRFRPNVVVAGFPAWAEDRWRRVRIGDARFRVVKACSRCVLTTVDPQTGAKGHEPLRTLARHRRWDGGMWFGVNLVPDTPGAVVRVNDQVEVLESTDG
jgi:uncharacterized protein YcbX/cold shock CspA family protein